MAKTFLASLHEISNIMDGDISAGCVEKDWYRRRFVSKAEGLLEKPINIEIPLALPRDKFEDSIIPGGNTSVEDADTVQLLEDCLKVDPDADYLFSVLAGKYYRARDDGPARLVLAEPKRSRDVMLLASWPKDTPSPGNFAEDEICESPVINSASFKDDGYGYCSAAWVIRSNSELGKLLIKEAQQSYFERLQAGIEHFRNYEQTYAEVRDGFWTEMMSMEHDATGDPSLPHLTCYSRYMHAEWYNTSCGPCDDFFFYTEIGTGSVRGLIKSWTKDGGNFSLKYAF